MGGDQGKTWRYERWLRGGSWNNCHRRVTDMFRRHREHHNEEAVTSKTTAEKKIIDRNWLPTFADDSLGPLLVSYAENSGIFEEKGKSEFSKIKKMSRLILLYYCYYSNSIKYIIMRRINHFKSVFFAFVAKKRTMRMPLERPSNRSQIWKEILGISILQLHLEFYSQPHLC